MAGALSAVSAFFSALGSIFGFARDRSKLKNTPAQKANADAKRDIKEKEKIQAVIAESERTGDLDEERKHFSE